MWKLQVPSSYSLGMVEKWHVTQDRRHMTCETRHVTHDRWFLSVTYIPLENIKLFGLVSKFSIISKSTWFLLKLDLHCNLPNFKHISNTSVHIALKICLFCPLMLCLVLCLLTRLLTQPNVGTQVKWLGFQMPLGQSYTQYKTHWTVSLPWTQKIPHSLFTP